MFQITIQDNHPDNLILNFAYNDRLSLSLPALGDEDRKNMSGNNLLKVDSLSKNMSGNDVLQVYSLIRTSLFPRLGRPVSRLTLIFLPTIVATQTGGTGPGKWNRIRF